MNLNERLDKLRSLVQNKDFLEGKGLSNEVNIHIFCYDAVDEMKVKHFISQITTDKTLTCNLIECNLYKIFLEICDELGIMDAIFEMEESDGSEFLLEQLQSAIGENDFIEKIKELGNYNIGDVLLLTGIGDVFPFIRVHKMLEALQPYFSDIPILVIYPGKFDGNYLKLFDKLSPSPYYRAFSIV